MAQADSSTHPLRVLTLVDGIGVTGGAERLAREIVSRLDPERFEATLCVSKWTPSRIEEPGAEAAAADLEAAGIRFLGLPRNGATDLLSWRPLLKLLRGEHFDIFHSHMFGSNVWAAIFGSLFRVPVIVAHEHTWSFEGQPMRKFLDRRLIGARADAFLAVSREDRRRMIEIERIDPRKVIFVPNGIPTPALPSGEDVRDELGIPAGAPVVGTVCVLRPQKALTVLLDAVALIAQRFPGLRLLIAGEGPERPLLEQRVAELGLGDVVTLLGLRNDVPDVLQGLDVAVSSSAYEGTPLSILEYMEAGLPIVATRVGGVPDLIEPGRHGLLVDPHDSSALARGIAELLEDRDRAARLGDAARDRRRSEFDIASTAKTVERIYMGLADGRSAADIAPAGVVEG